MKTNKKPYTIILKKKAPAPKIKNFRNVVLKANKKG